MHETNFFVVGCLHGRKPRIRTKKIDAIIATGDFCHDKIRKYFFASLRDHQPWWKHAGGKPRALKLLRQSFLRGRKILQQLNAVGLPVFVLPGNWDFPLSDAWVKRAGLTWANLIKGLKNIHDCHLKRRTFHGYTFVGHGVTNCPEYPQHKDILRNLSKKDFIKRKKAYTKRLHQVSQLFTNKPTIFLTHNVPFNTKLDKIINKASPRNGMHFGSVLARDIVKKHKPLICIGAHMHEHYRDDNIGKTPCINAGFGSKCRTLVTLTGNKVKIQFLAKKYG
jgi:Icc-related predicted phosphoesterase